MSDISGKRNYSTERPCVACGILTDGGNTLHHVKTRGSGGGDEIFNLMPLCFVHHTQVHQLGLLKFSEIYRPVTSWLERNGWLLDGFLKKWVHLA